MLQPSASLAVCAPWFHSQGGRKLFQRWPSWDTHAFVPQPAGRLELDCGNHKAEKIHSTSILRWDSLARQWQFTFFFWPWLSLSQNCRMSDGNCKFNGYRPVKFVTWSARTPHLSNTDLFFAKPFCVLHDNKNKNRKKAFLNDPKNHSFPAYSRAW